MRALTDDLVTFLLGPRAKTVLAELTARPLPESETPAVLTALRREFSPAEAAALLDQARLRQRAHAKFGRAEAMFFTDEALQQASGETIAIYRAQRYAGFARVADLGCGIGGDSIALARAGPAVVAVDLDRVRLRLARANAETYGVAERILFVEPTGPRCASKPMPPSPTRPGASRGGESSAYTRCSRHCRYC